MWNISDFLSMHGIGHAIASKGKTINIFWCSVVITCIVLAAYFLHKLLTDYLEYETYWAVTEEVQSSIAFPVVTMCNGLRRYHMNQSNISLFTDGFTAYKNENKNLSRISSRSTSSDTPSTSDTPRKKRKRIKTETTSDQEPENTKQVPPAANTSTSDTPRKRRKRIISESTADDEPEDTEEVPPAATPTKKKKSKRSRVSRGDEHQ